MFIAEKVEVIERKIDFAADSDSRRIMVKFTRKGGEAATIVLPDDQAEVLLKGLFSAIGKD